MSEQDKKIASPVATGSSGTFFEQHVGVTWLSLLLVRGIPPIFTDSQVSKVIFQARRFGWETDDHVITTENAEKKIRKLVCQVKRSFTVSSANDECRKTFLSFWKDFKSTRFDIALDRLCLVTLKGTNSLLVHFASLLEAANNSKSLEDFQQRLSVKGILNATAKNYAEEVKKGLEQDGEVVSDSDLWSFLKSISVLSFDLNTTTSQTESWMKSLLALTANTSDKIGTGKATWNSLLDVVSKAMPAAQEITFDDIPEELRKVHGSIPSADTTSLLALQKHSAVVLKGIQSTIGNKHSLSRDAVVADVAKKLRTNKIVVVSGPAGIGKSAVAKKVLESFSLDSFTLSFRSEEFAKTHIDETFQAAGLGMSAEKLFSLLAAQGQKVILIESAERLLEASVRDGFKDFLNFIEKDSSLKVIITCRSYSLDIFVSSFLGQSQASLFVSEVPPLTDDELNEVKEKVPELIAPLTSEKLVRVLRVPYVLDKAAKMSWKDSANLPSNERDFRRLFWKEIVREDAVMEHGLPAKREHALTQVAIRRAKALSMYAKSDDLDPLALQRLRQGDLIVASEDTGTLNAPAHDLLEDWVLLNWIEAVYSQVEGIPEKLATEIGTFPALRRSYRLWLSERSNLNPAQTDEYISKVLKSSSLSAHFRDDTLVSILRSDAGGEFVLRNREILLEKNAYLLKRVVHLLRVACKSMPVWLRRTGYLQSSVMVPEGAAWVSTLKLVNESLDEFVKNESGLLLGFVEDWVNLVDMDNSAPEGSREAAIIAFRLLEVSAGYRHDKVRKKIFSVLSKIPLGDSEAFLKILEKGMSGDRDAEEFLDFLVEGHQSSFVAKAYPDELIQILKKQTYFSNKKRSGHDFYERMEVDNFFGLKDHMNFHPASALRGPFYPLLKNHFRKGIDFIIEFLNYTSTCYANPTTDDRLEPPWEIEISFADGSKSKQWHNPRLWQMYRGTSVGPYVVMSSLMALEKRLLEIGAGEAKHLDSWLVYILKNSNNSSLSAVVSSVVVAHPQKCKEAAKVLLSCRDFIEIDQSMSFSGRMSSIISEMLPSFDAESQFYEQERKESDYLPHRSKNLIQIAFELQLRGMDKEVQAIIDSHLGSLPPIDLQNEGEKLWRFTLHKMDARKYTARVATPEEATGSADSPKNRLENETEGATKIVFEPTSPEEDIKQIIARDTPKISRDQELIGMFNWAHSCFSRDGKADPSLWEAYLKKAMELGVTDLEEYVSWNDSPSIVAAVCVRDHWLELTEPQKNWCFKSLEKSISRDATNMTYMVRGSRNSMSSDRHSALAVAAVISHERKSAFRERAIEALSNSLFHSCEEVTKYAAAGVGQFLWDKDSDLVKKVVNALIHRAISIGQAFEDDYRKDYSKRSDPYELQAKINTEVRKKFLEGDLFNGVSVDALDFRARWTSGIFEQLLYILNSSVDAANPLMKSFYGSIVSQLCEWWTRDRKGENVPYQLMYSFMDFLAAYVLRLEPNEALKFCEPILSLVATHSRDAGKFLEDLVYAVDKNHQYKNTFWALWKEFGERVKKADWIKKLDSEYSSGDEILRPLFLAIRWKNGSRSWIPHQGYESFVLDLYKDLPASGTALDYLALYFYYVGDMVLPKGFVTASDKLKGVVIKAHSNSIFCLEQTMQRHVYGTPQKLKSDPLVREAVINILDFLVDSGSSAAFKMRDDFVTPMSGV